MTSLAPPRPAASRDTSRRRDALRAGVATLAMAPLGMFGNIVVLGLDAANPGGIAERVVDTGLLLNLAIVAFLAVVILDVIVAWGLARFFAGQGDGLPNLAAWLRVTYAAVLGVATAQLAVASDLAAAGAADSAVHASILGFTLTWQLGLVVFAAHLGVLAALVIRDVAAPTVLGGFIAVAGVGYATDGIARLFLAAGSPVVVGLTAIVALASIGGEIGFAIWLLARGGRSR